RQLQITHKLPAGTDPDKAMQELVAFAKRTRIPAAEVALTLEGMAYQLTSDAYKDAADQYPIALLAAHALLATEQLAPSFAFLGGPWKPVTAAQWRITTANMLVTALGKDPGAKQQNWYKKTLATIDKLLAHAGAILAKQPNQADKDVADRLKELKE